jgi:predicted MFS family arabinose efflux permease
VTRRVETITKCGPDPVQSATATGILYAALGPGPAFGINAASFLVSAGALAGPRLPTTPGSTRRAGFFTDAAAGIRLLARDRLLRALGAGQVLAALSAGATSALLVVLAADHLQLPPSGFGLLLGAIGVGAVLGPFLLTRLVTDPRRPAFVFGPYVLRGLVDLVLATFTALPVALAALAAYGLGTSRGAVTFNSLLQAHTPPEARGRIFAGFDVFWQLGRLVSLLIGGLLAAASVSRPSTASAGPCSCWPRPSDGTPPRLDQREDRTGASRPPTSTDQSGGREARDEDFG